MPIAEGQIDDERRRYSDCRDLQPRPGAHDASRKAVIDSSARPRASMTGHEREVDRLRAHLSVCNSRAE